MKLHDLANGTWFKWPKDAKLPPGAPKVPVGSEVRLAHIDGMYSLCWYEGKPVHLVAWAEVEVCDDPA